jgi:hypothetical protein
LPRSTQARAPLPLRGRTTGNRGAPVGNLPVHALVAFPGKPRGRWELPSPGLVSLWDAEAAPVASWDAGETAYTNWHADHLISEMNKIIVTSIITAYDILDETGSVVLLDEATRIIEDESGI